MNVAIFANYAGLLSILLPNQIEAIDPAQKVSNLAIVTSVSFAFTVFAQPLVGALSDRTRSRLGRRAPWMLGGSVVAGAFLLAFGGMGSIVWICVFWVIIHFALNAVDVSSSAFLPDRVPRKRRGIASAVLGIGAMGGAAVGTVLAGPLAREHRGLAYMFLGLGVVLVTVLFVMFNRESSTVERDVSPFRWREFVRGFWVSPRRHPDFAWAFVSRFFFIIGYSLILTYQLYILTDYVELSTPDANLLIGLLTVAGFATTVVGILIGGWWSDRMGRRKVFVIVASGILMVGLAVPLISATTGALVAFALIQGLAAGVYLSSGTALIVDVLPDRGSGAAKDLGIYNIATNIPQAMAPALAAFVIHAFGSFRPLFAFALIAAAVSALLITRVKGVR